MATLHVTLVTPEGTPVDTDAASVILPAWDGQLGILPGHAPLLVKLGSGVIEIKPASGQPIRKFIAGGFAQVEANVLTVLTGEASELSSLDRAAAEAELAAAREERAHGDAAIEAKFERQERARAKLHAIA